MLIIAHRGLSKRYPDNTMPAFEDALRHDPDAIEIDVRKTLDGVLVVRHDRRFRRSAFAANYGLGIWGAQVRDMSFATLRSLVPHICTLDQALSFVGNRCDIFVEVKEADIAESVYMMCRSMASRFVIISFYERVIAKIHEIAPSCRKGLISCGSSVNNIEAARKYNCFVSIQDFEYIERHALTPFIEAGIPVIVFTVNVGEDARKARDMGARGVITDRCDIAREWFKKD